MLPIIPGDSVNYKWGYRGVEPSEFLFDRDSVSKTLRAKYFDEKYMDLYTKFIDGGDYNQDLSEMNIKYLVLNNDLIPEASGASSSAQVRAVINHNSKIKLSKTIGALDIYEYKPNTDSSLFAVSGTSLTSVSYKKISSTHYSIGIKSANEPYEFIFKETFNPLWLARVNGVILDKHFLKYSYANAWEINKKGDYNIDVVFKVWPWE